MEVVQLFTRTQWSRRCKLVPSTSHSCRRWSWRPAQQQMALHRQLPFYRLHCQVILLLFRGRFNPDVQHESSTFWFHLKMCLLRHVRREWALLSFHSVYLSVSHSATYSLPRLIDHNQIWLAGIYLSSDTCKPFWIPYLPYFRCQREKYA